jgi:hypothetical protein
MFNSGLNPDVVKSGLDSVFFGEFDYPNIPGVATAENALLFKQSTSDRQAVITEEYSGVGEFEAIEEEGENPEATVRTGNKQTHAIVNYKKALLIPKEFYDDDQHDTIDNSVSRCGIRARTTRDKNALLVYGGGFDSTLTGDAAYLFSASHTSLNGDTIDNLETGAFTPDALEVLVRTLIEQKSQDGELGGHNPAALLVPPILFPDAIEAAKSELKADSMDNNLNYFSTIYPGLQVFQSPFVGSNYNTSTYANTGYYLVGRNHGITRWKREDIYTRIVSWEYDRKDRWTYKMGFREKVAPQSWEGCAASNGSV